MPRRTRSESYYENRDHLKLAVAQYVAARLVATRWTQRQAAARLGTSQANISHVMRGRIDDLTYNQLFRYLIRLEPHTRILLSKH